MIGQLLHKHSFIHGIDYYGSFLGIQKQYRFDIIDDLEYLQTYDFFHENISKLFHTSVFQHSYHNHHNSKKNKPTLAISDESCNIDFETLDNAIEQIISPNGENQWKTLKSTSAFFFLLYAFVPRVGQPTA